MKNEEMHKKDLILAQQEIQLESIGEIEAKLKKIEKQKTNLVILNS